MYLPVCVCICMYVSVSICMGMYLLVSHTTPNSCTRLYLASFGLIPDGAEAGRDAGLGGTPPLAGPALGCAPSPVLDDATTSTAPARAHCAHFPTGGVGRCLQAEGHGCLLGCLGP
jgi:hypothetical protein